MYHYSSILYKRNNLQQIKQFIYLLLTLITVVAGYFYLRYAYKVTDSTPFTQEIVLIILGTITTVFITALLLNKQTAVEIEKEQNIKFLDLKAQTYQRLLDIMEEMASENRLKESDITKLQFITHRLAIFASPNVLNEYNNFLEILSRISKDGTLSNDAEILSEALGKLTIQIRFDLLGENTHQKSYTVDQIKKIIKRNSNSSSHINLE
jgi:type II secretory pathway pseudopilin PulG